MKFSKAFTYMFEDPNYMSKYLIGILISIVPILNLAWLGYGIGIMRNIARGEALPLPSWDNVGEKFKDGFMVAIASLVFTLPLWLLMCLAYVVMLLAASAGGEGDTAMAIGTTVYILMGCCSFVYILVYSFFFPALMIHYSRLGTFAALFQFKDIFALATKNIGQYLMGWLAGLVAGLLVGVVAVIPCIGQLAAIAFGQAYMTSVTSYAYAHVGLALSPENAYAAPQY